MSGEQGQQRDGRPLLPSFASGRRLPPPVPSGYSSSRGSDPRAYACGGSGGGSSGMEWSGGGLATANGAGGGGGYGGRLSPAASSSFARPATVHPAPRRPLSPARSTLSLRPSQPSFTSPPLPSSNNGHFLRSAASVASFSTRTTAPPPHRPSSPPLISGGAGRPNVSALPPLGSRTRRVSQVEPDSPTVYSRAPSPAYGNPADRHRSTHANEPGYRSLVRRASGSNLSSAAASAGAPRPSLPSYSTAPSLPPASTPYLPPTTRPPLSTAAVQSLPTYSPSIPLTNRPSSPPKRTNFSALELRMLQGLWNSGGYYPSVQQVEEVQQKTGLSRTQIRNWFANRRQRSSGEEKSRVQRMARELGVA